MKSFGFLQIWEPDLTQVFFIAVNNYEFVEIFVKTKPRPFKMYQNFKTHLPFFNGSRFSMVTGLQKQEGTDTVLFDCSFDIVM